MRRAYQVCKWLTAFATLLVILLLAWLCIDIYEQGTAEVGRGELNSIFSMDNVANRIGTYKTPLTVYVLFVVFTGMFHAAIQHATHKSIQTYHISSSGNIHKAVQGTENTKMRIPLQIVIGILAILFIMLGVMNGGWYDVFVKAIKICTECIGLG